VKLLPDLQILGCELHKNAFHGPWTRWGAIALPQTLAFIRGEGRGKGKERVGNREGKNAREGGMVRGGSRGGDRAGKGKGRLDLDICPGAVEFLVMRLDRKNTSDSQSLSVCVVWMVASIVSIMLARIIF